MKVFAFVRYCVVLASLLATGHAVATAKVPSLLDDTGITWAIMQGDLTLLQGTLDKMKAPPQVRQTALSALQGDIRATAKAAKSCRDAGQAVMEKAPAAIKLTMLCNMFLSGATMADGDPRAWAESAVWANDIGLPALAKFQGISGSGTSGRDMSGIRRLAANGPTTQVSVPGGRLVAPASFEASRDGSGGEFLTADVLVNGTKLRAMIDLGYSGGLLLTEAGAKKARVDSIPGTESGLDSPYSVVLVASRRQLGVAKNLTFANITWHDYLVSVTPANTGFDATIGAHMLLSQDGVSVSRDAVNLAPESCDQGLPLTLHTNPYLDMRLTFPAKVGNADTTLSVDTGAMPSLLGMGGLYATLRSVLPPLGSARANLAGASTSFRSTTGPVVVSLGGATYPIKDATFLPDSPDTIGGVLGAGFLREHSLTIDVKRRRMCVDRQSAGT
ncbi:hypothetical protein ABIE56_003332 [Luteibacter sp. 621]|uniref:hypothetical protein n=1 Tax=Luteibacter sp. 621 TaxID=3373916 RepID=UPI003D21F71A